MPNIAQEIDSLTVVNSGALIYLKLQDCTDWRSLQPESHGTRSWCQVSSVTAMAGGQEKRPARASSHMAAENDSTEPPVPFEKFERTTLTSMSTKMETILAH